MSFVSRETLSGMVIHFFSCPILLIASSIELRLREQEIIIDAITARVGRYLRSALLPVYLDLLEVDLVRPVFMVVFPHPFHRPKGV